MTATTTFVNSILNDPAVTSNEKAIRALMGIKSTLGFVIDTTGSMGDIIGQVQAEVVATVNSVVGTPNEPDQYLLEPFNDPTWGPSFTTADASAFIAAVNALTASGGDGYIPPYTVINFGPSATFNVSAVDNLGFISGVSPSVLTLASGASGPVSVSVTVPSGTSIGKIVQITTTATSTADSTLTNSTVQSLTVTNVVDPTPPTITVSASPSLLWPPNGMMVPVAVSGTITDTGSGVNLSSGTFAVSDEYGTVQPTGPMSIDGNGKYSFIVNLQAFRLGSDKDGRQYTISAFAKDNAGNLGSNSIVVTVPHDQGH
ncbi:MAG TPA: hypothetical protein VGV15_20695 [Terriglobales bacterium]|nr:hypothetical protein [Terriglobales bacterium]